MTPQSNALSPRRFDGRAMMLFVGVHMDIENAREEIFRPVLSDHAHGMARMLRAFGKYTEKITTWIRIDSPV